MNKESYKYNKEMKSKEAKNRNAFKLNKYIQIKVYKEKKYSIFCQTVNEDFRLSILLL